MTGCRRGLAVAAGLVLAGCGGYVAQDAIPKSGTVGDAVDAPVTVPDVVNPHGRTVPGVETEFSSLSPDDAIDGLNRAGLLAEVPTVPDIDAVSSGVWVAAQDPRAGQVVARGSTVELKLEPGLLGSLAVLRDFAPVEVDDLVGMPLRAAIAWVERRRLWWRVVGIPALPPVADGGFLDHYVVSDQEPKPGTKLGQGVIVEHEDGTGFQPTPVTLRVRLREG